MRHDPLAAAAGTSASDPWLHHMRRGDFEAAWLVSDAVLRSRAGVPCWHLPRHEQYLWDGGDLAGRRVLVRCYHGLGDTLQFVRYAPLLRRKAAGVLVWVQPALLPLVRTVGGIDGVLPLDDGPGPSVPYDAEVESMELPHVFRTTLDRIPASVPYVHVGSAPRPAPAGAFHVGVIWRAGDWDDRRSIPGRRLEALAAVPGVRLHALQQGAALSEWHGEWGDVLSRPDPLELARTMRALDLVITVDSFPAHLAGALGVPTWTLLHADPDWRWMVGREDTPWYPTMRLWRQVRGGDWDGVVRRVAAELSRVAAARLTTGAARSASRAC